MGGDGLYSVGTCRPVAKAYIKTFSPPNLDEQADPTMERRVGAVEVVEREGSRGGGGGRSER